MYDNFISGIFWKYYERGIMFTFYREYENTSRTIPTGNCLAVDRETIPLRLNDCADAIVALTNDPDSYCCSGSVSLGYLAKWCKRISKKTAYQEHSHLQEFIEQ